VNDWSLLLFFWRCAVFGKRQMGAIGFGDGGIPYLKKLLLDDSLTI
jgi:hypothetical protein